MKRAVIAMLCLVPSPALADAQAEAIALFDQGVKDLKAGDFAKACKELAASFDKVPDSGTKGALALCYTSLGRVATAWQMWRDLADTAPTAVLRKDAQKKADKLAPRVPHYLVKLKAPTPGLVVAVNGGKVDPSVGLPLPIDPGKVSVTADAPGYESWTAELTAVEGGQLDIEVPALAEVKKSKSKDSKDTPVLDGGAAKATFQRDLKLGGSVDGAFARDDQLDGYTLAVRAGARVKLEITHAGSKMGLDTVVFVYGPAKGGGYPASAIYADDDSGWGKLSKIASATLAEAGTYAVVVGTKGGKGRGNYRLVTTCLNEPCDPDSGASNDVPPPRMPPPDNSARHRRHLIGLGIGGVGLASAVVGGVFGLSASGQWSDAKQACGGDITRCPAGQLAAAQKHVDDARSAANLSTIFLGAGGAAVAVGAIVWLTAPRLVERHDVGVLPVVGNGSIGLAVSGSL
jgi:hypothetical protein